MVWRVLGVVSVLLVLGAGAGFAAGALLGDSPTTISVATPVPASSPSAPVEPERSYAPDIDYPTLGADLAYAPQRVGQGEFTWGYVAPRGWSSIQRGPGEVAWSPRRVPVDGSFGMRVKIINERKTTSAMVEQKIADLADAVQDVTVLGRTTDSLAITFRATPSNRLRYNTFRWFTRAGQPDAQFEVSVNGRAQDLRGLGDLLDQIAASVRFDPPEPTTAPADEAPSRPSVDPPDSPAPRPAPASSPVPSPSTSPTTPSTAPSTAVPATPSSSTSPATSAGASPTSAS